MSTGKTLLSGYPVGKLKLKNRIALAPMTRDSREYELL